LAICAAVVGFAFDQTFARGGTHRFGEFLLRTPSLADGAAAATREPFAFHLSVAGLSSAIALAGVLLATYLYLGSRQEVEWLRSLFDFDNVSRWLEGESLSRWRNVGWIAALQQAAQRIGLGWLTAGIGHVIQLLGLVLAAPFLLGHFVSPYKLSFDKFYIDELYQLLIVWPLRALAWVCYVIDRYVVDAAVNAIGRLPVLFGGLMRSLQMGLVQFYALAMVLGLVVLFAARWMWAAG
jgi:NADH-quinone oxidoreductase subunit L